MNEPLVSVIVTTKNSAATLKPLLKSVKDQIYPKVEIIVVDNKSMDKTKEVAATFTKLVFNKGPERSVQRNFGVNKAKGKFVLILDSDMMLNKDVIKKCVDKFQKLKNKKIGGLIIPEISFGEGIWAKAKALEREINKGEDFFESARFFPKSIFWKFGGYDSNLTGPEDWDLPQRIHKKFAIERIKSYIKHNEGELTLKTLFKKKLYYGLSTHRYLTKQRIPLFSPTTVYFLRPALYKKWRKLFQHPTVTLAMIFMLTIETVGGGIGYIKGRLNK